MDAGQREVADEVEDRLLPGEGVAEARRVAHDRGRPLAVGRAPPRDRAGAAGRLARMADSPTMPDEHVREECPVFGLEELVHFEFELHGVGLDSPTEAACESPEVRVDGDTWDAESVAEYDVGRLATDAWQRDEIFEIVRNLPAEICAHFLSHAEY